jgi:DNA-binding NarL/FixJ family response regulator
MSGGAGTIRVFLADDHRILRDSLKTLLSQEPGIEVVGAAEDGAEALEMLARLAADCTGDTGARDSGAAHAPAPAPADVLILDISMPRRGGLEVSREATRLYSGLRVIFLTMHKGEDMLADAFGAGASGYVLKENAFDELVKAIRRVMSGSRYVPSEFSDVLLNGFLVGEKGENGMSAREREILKLLAEGYSNREIAEMLVISAKTVETHRSNIMRKNGFKNITELVLYAARNRLIEI